ncbi:two-component system response regulator [Clostridia bacterium]|nr:two-component system response regulator [Clostridia bacterium]
MQDTKKTVFLVDDNMTNLMVGKKALSEQYRTFTIPSAAKMFEMLDKVMPDLILLDVDMPEMDGYEAIKILKQNEERAKIPVIFLTAKVDNQSELDGLALGAVDYVHKPFSQALLLKRIEIHLLVQSQKHELEFYAANLEEMVAAKTAEVVSLENAVLLTFSELVECRDDVTGGHIQRTSAYLDILLNEMSRQGVYTDIIKDWNKDMIVKSCQLHDVGKVAVSDTILNKPSKLTPEEYEIMKQHTVFGVKVIETIESRTIGGMSFLTDAKLFAGTHHEKWDGTGYPARLAEDDIPLQGRIMAIADVYDALVSVRPYKKAFTHEEAAAVIIEGSGSFFDPKLIAVFKSIAEMFREAAERANTLFEQ